MKFNPISKKLYTDNNVLIKKLHCPISMDWNKLSIINENSRTCSVCEKSIFDTDNLSDEVVSSMVESDPSVCLKVCFNQDNIRVISHEI
jgi:hypothetical protein